MTKTRDLSAKTGLAPHLLDALDTALSNAPAVAKAYIFGSRARGDFGPKSDIDLALLAPDAGIVQWFDLLDAIEILPTLLETDVVRLDEADRDLRMRIEEEGLVVYDRSSHGAVSHKSGAGARQAR